MGTLNPPGKTALPGHRVRSHIWVAARYQW